MKDIRVERTVKKIHNPWDKSGRDAEGEEVRHALADTGGIESDRTLTRAACDCGCVKPPGGFCSSCHGLICVSCFYRCALCDKPLGPCCGIMVQESGGQAMRLCKECHDARKRKNRVISASRLALGPLRLLLSPFIRIEK
jgi:hypothetical protein